MSHQELQSLFGFLEAVDELGLARGLAQRVSVPSARRRGREGHLGESIPLGGFHLPAVQKAQQKWVLRPGLLKMRGSGKGKLPLCTRGSVLCQRCPWRAAPPELLGLDPWLCRGIDPALLGRELRYPPCLHPCPSVLPVCSGCCTAPAGAFFWLCLSFLLQLSCGNASAAFWSRVRSTGMSSGVQLRICCEDRSPRD